MTQPTLFDAAEAREDAIRRADANADTGWKEAAYEAVLSCARILEDFTADDVWDVLQSEYPSAWTHEPAALGPVFIKAAKDGKIVKTGRLRPTRARRRHRDLTVWMKRD